MLIKVSPEILRNSSQRVEVISNETEGWYDRIKSLAHHLKDIWFGPGGEMAFESVIELLQYVNECRDALKENGDTLLNIAQAFEAVDSEKPAVAFKTGVIPMPHVELKLISNGFMQSSGMIHIEPDEVRQIANELNKVADNIRNAYSDLKKTRNELKSEWQGRAAEKFMDNFIEISRAFPKLADAINDVTNNIIIAANHYEEIDNMLG